MTTTFSEQARVDIREIGFWTATEWGQVQAENYSTHLVALFQAISKSPTSPVSKVVTPSISSLRLRHIRSVFRPGRHVAIYMVTETGVHILRILHEKMDIPTIIETYLEE